MSYIIQLISFTFSMLLLSLLFGIIVEVNSQQQQYYGASPLRSSISIETSMPTVTVRGFLNFRTTVDGTVIVFTPSPNLNSRTSSIDTSTPNIEPTKAPARLDEIKPTRPSAVATYPTGLVTVLGGTVVNEGSTTVYETKVIGTYISGKYAQILSSTTKVKPNDEVTSPTIRFTTTYSQSTVRPTRTLSQPPKQYSNNNNYHHHHHHHQQQQHNHRTNQNQRNEDEHTANAITGTIKKVHPLRAKSMKLVENAKDRHLNARLQLNPLKSRWAKLKDNNDNNNDGENLNVNENKPTVKVRRLKIIGSKRFTLPPRQSPRIKMNRFKTKLPPTQAEEMQQYYNSKVKEKEDEENSNENVDDKQIIDEKIKEKILENLTSTGSSNNEYNNTVEEKHSLGIDPSKVIKEVQTITSEVTQHVEGNHLQVKTLTLTTTIERTLHPTESEFDTNLIQPTLDISVNNIEATSIPETPALVISRTYSVTERTMRTTVVPVFDGTATQSHTVTESFFIRKLITAYRTLPPGDMILIDSTSTSAFNPEINTVLFNMTDVDDLSMAEQQTIQPTSVDVNILPTEMPNILDETNISNGGTLDESVLVNQIEPSLTFGMPQLFPTVQPPPTPIISNNNHQLAQQFDLNNPLLLAAVLQNPQLAAVYLGLQQMKQQATQYSTITKPTKVIQTETLYNTKMVSYYDGRQTRSRTILEPTGTTEKFINTFTTEVVPIMNNQYAMQQAQLQNMFATQFGMMPQFQMTPTLQNPIKTVLKTLTTVTDATMTKSKDPYRALKQRRDAGSSCRQWGSRFKNNNNSNDNEIESALMCFPKREPVNKV